MIHVCFGLYDKTGRYSKFTGTTVCSLFENTTSPVTVHILHDDTLTEDNRGRFIRLARRYNQTVKFYNVDEFCANKIAEIAKFCPSIMSSHLTIGTFYRLWIPQLFTPDVDKVIYLDSDIVVNLDINEFWQIDLGDKALASVPEILSYKTVENMKRAFPLCRNNLAKCEDYFNAGVLVMNLKILRYEEDTITNGLRFCLRNSQYMGYGDQDIWNYCFSTRALKLPTKFNRFTVYARQEDKIIAEKIYHYAGGSFGYGLGLDLNDSFNRLWMDYFIKSTFFDADTIGRLCEVFLQREIERKKSALKLSSIISGKTRTFVIIEKDIKSVVENFSVKPGEEVFALESTLPIPKLIDMMNAARGKKIFFILLPNFPFNTLTTAGFVQGEDFFDGYDFSPENKISRKEEYFIVKDI